MFSTKVQALWAGVVGVSPLHNVLVSRIPKWVCSYHVLVGLSIVLYALSVIW
jgi:NAD/NADP transhydrogenase beta subunit